jgi:hypothetical protein
VRVVEIYLSGYATYQELARDNALHLFWLNVAVARNRCKLTCCKNCGNAAITLCLRFESKFHLG